MFPDAKFVFIHRDPYEVYPSAMHLWRTMVRDQMLQDFTEAEIQDMVIWLFRETVQGYLKQRASIPEGKLVEIGYKELGGNPIKTLRSIYSGLEVEGWEMAKPEFEAYLNSIKGYRRNQFQDLGPEEIETDQYRMGILFR